MTNIKVRTEKIKERGAETRKFYVNDILVCECRISSNYYCTVSKSGHPSNIRNKWKKTYRTNWNRECIRKLVGDYPVLYGFTDDYPDLTWGHQGSIVTAKKVKQIFEKYGLKPLPAGEKETE